MGEGRDFGKLKKQSDRSGVIAVVARFGGLFWRLSQIVSVGRARQDYDFLWRLFFSLVIILAPFFY